jgi:hypothetical protein
VGVEGMGREKREKRREKREERREKRKEKREIPFSFLLTLFSAF